MEETNTIKQYNAVIGQCRSLFINKMKDYGSAWRILRLPSLTDQIYIKAQRIRGLQENAVHLIDEDERAEFIGEARSLMVAKNHDYGEVWREMRVSSLTDIILQKLLRVKQIEDNEGKTLVSEGIDANYQDMINYAVFAMILLGIRD